MDRKREDNPLLKVQEKTSPRIFPVKSEIPISFGDLFDLISATENPGLPTIEITRIYPVPAKNLVRPENIALAVVT